MKPVYTRDSIVAVHPFTRQQEGGEVVIGSLEGGVFLAIPAEAVELLDELALGKSVGEVSDRYYQATGVVPDLDDLLTLLQSKGLVETHGEDSDAKQSLQPISQRRYHFSSFPRGLAEWIFGRFTLALGTLIVALAFAAVFRDHALMPVPMDLVFDHQRAFAWTLLTILAYVGVYLHELAHLIAARAAGVNSRIDISHRLWYLVAETDLTGLWSVPRNRRYLPMLAGLIVDLVSTSLLILLLFGEQRHAFPLSPFTVHLFRAVAFTNMMRMLWEFFLFTRTDLYFVAATFLNCKNLLNDTTVFLRNQLAVISRRVRPVDQTDIPEAERRAIRVYVPLFLAGRAWAFITLFWVMIPVTVSYWRNLLSSFRIGYSANPADFLDALAAAVYFMLPAVAGFVLSGRALVRSKGV
jgi:putative peptide zinc metalloprotease protein